MKTLDSRLQPALDLLKKDWVVNDWSYSGTCWICPRCGWGFCDYVPSTSPLEALSGRSLYVVRYLDVCYDKCYQKWSESSEMPVPDMLQIADDEPEPLTAEDLKTLSSAFEDFVNLTLTVDKTAPGDKSTE